MNLHAVPASLGAEVRSTVQPRTDWNRSVTPAHFVAFVTGCAVCGFVGGVGLAALVSSALAKRCMDALGW